MIIRKPRTLWLTALLLHFQMASAFAQYTPTTAPTASPPPAAPATAASAASTAAPNPPPLSDAELEQLVAPVALYPDSLLSQIFMASTYPLEIVRADRF